MDSDIILTLRPDRAVLVLAALKVIGSLARGEPDDPDTELTAEAFETYLDVACQAYGGDTWQSSANSAEVYTLAEQLERDMLLIIHRNYTRTTEGFVRK